MIKSNGQRGYTFYSFLVIKSFITIKLEKSME